MTPSRTPRRAWRGAVLAAVLAPVALALAGCSATNEITTSRAYEPSDGIGVEVGDVRAGNLLVVATAEGGPGAVVGYLTNSGDDTVQVSVAPEGADDQGTQVRVPAGATVLLGPDHEPVDLDAVPAAPGGTVPLALVVDGRRSAVVAVPVLDGTLPEYADLVPED